MLARLNHPNIVSLFDFGESGGFFYLLMEYVDGVNAVVLCCDEKSQCQALERQQPGLPLGQGQIRTRTHDYYRHGTVCFFAALDYLPFRIISQIAPRHRHQEWLRFLRQIEWETPRELAPRFHLHYTPTSSSWMNLVERFFRDFSQELLAPGSFASVGALTEAMFTYIAQ